MGSDKSASCAKSHPLECISQRAATEYSARLDSLIEYVDRTMGSLEEIDSLIGENPREVMYSNHRNHAGFISALLQLRAVETLKATLPWVYRAYMARGFSGDYFLTVLPVWILALREHLSKEAADEIATLYQWIASEHTTNLSTASNPEMVDDLSGNLTSQAAEFLSMLLEADYRGCMELAEDVAETEGGLERFCIDIVQPSLYRVGTLWERGEVSVAEEHMMTAIVSRVMAGLYSRLSLDQKSKGDIVVSSATNELHDVGGRVVADLLEADGWNVSYLGANTPVTELMEMVRALRPFILALSISMVANLPEAKGLIAKIKSDEELKKTRVIVGGQAFNYAPKVQRYIGADGYAKDGRDAVALANSWWESSSR